MSAAKTNHDRVTAMTHHRLLPRRLRTDRQQEAADIAGTGEPHDPTNGDGVNQVGENEQPWTPSGLLDLGQNEEVRQGTRTSNREKDVLTQALGTKEHPSRTELVLFLGN